MNIHQSVIERCSDTVVLVILLGMMDQRYNLLDLSSQEKRVVMDCGAGNYRRLINLDSMYHALENKQEGLTLALPSLHAFIGCKYTPAFYRKGKVQPLKFVMKSKTFVSLLQSMNVVGPIDVRMIQKFVCEMYNVPLTDNYSSARHTKLRSMTSSLKRIQRLSRSF